MTVLALLADGSCRITGTCLNKTSEAVPQCPQSFKCGTCVAWAPMKENEHGRNSGTCLLNQNTRMFLDCNSIPCPYYRPRVDNPVYEEWQRRPRRAPTPAKRGGRRRSLDREAPPPSPEALAQAAFDGHGSAVAEAGTRILAAELRSLGNMPVLLERFRGGSVRVEGGSVAARETSLEAFYARLALLRRSLVKLQEEIDASSLGDPERGKINKDLSGMAGSLTTFNLLFKNKEEQFRGAGRGG